MKHTSQRCHGDVALPGADADRIHNSGYGRPPEQYLTPAVGSGFVIDLHRTLLAWHPAPDDLRELLVTISGTRRRYPADAVCRCARALVEALSGETPPTTEVRATLAQLCDLVVRAHLTDGVVLMCLASMRGEAAPAPAGNVSAQDAALALVTTVCMRKPTVMWGIEPSLENVTVNGVLRARWLHRSGAGAAATTAWKSMMRITAPGGAHA